MATTQWYGTGRRKQSTARVFLRSGTGRITINNRDVDEFFHRETLKMVLRQPLTLTETAGDFDLYVTVRGGGESGQAGAIRHGISRALCENNLAHRPTLKAAGLLTRDARKVERKKPGQPGARKKFQFSKR